MTFGAYGISTGGNTSGTSGTNYGTIVFAASGNLTASQSTGSNGVHGVTFSAPTETPLSYYPSLPVLWNTSYIRAVNSSQQVFPFIVNKAVSFDRLRFICSQSCITTTLATAIGGYGSSQGHSSTLNVVLYSRMTGASSLSYGSISSTSISGAVAFSFSGTSSTHSKYMSFTWHEFAGTSSTSYSLAIGTGSTNVLGSVAELTLFTAGRFQDIPWASSIAPGNYYMGLQYQTTTGGGIAAYTTLQLNQSIGAVTHFNAAIGFNNLATNSTNVIQPGLGSVSTNATTAIGYSFAQSNVSTNANHPIPYFQLTRVA